MDDLAAVRRSQLPCQLERRTPQQTWKLCRIKVDQPAGHRVTVLVKKFHWISGDEVPFASGHARGKQ